MYWSWKHAWPIVEEVGQALANEEQRRKQVKDELSRMVDDSADEESIKSKMDQAMKMGKNKAVSFDK